MSDKEALSIVDTMKLALEALENSVDLVVEDAYNAEKLYGNYPTRQGKVGGLKILADQHKKAITAIKEALSSPTNGEAQPEQEPVAWWVPKAEQFCLPSSDGTRPFAKAWEPLYTTPPQGIYYSPPQRTWVGLTPFEIDAIIEDAIHPMDALLQTMDKLKEKNT